jgi:hypothetical protein
LTVRSRIGARQAWPTGQRHQAGWPEVAMAVAGVAARLRVRSHSLAILGCNLAREFVELTLRLPQNGQDAFVRTVGATGACQEWSGPRGHRHQTAFFDHRMTCRGVSPRFLVRFHRAATLGCVVARQFVIETFLLLQKGHPFICFALWTLRLHS